MHLQVKSSRFRQQSLVINTYTYLVPPIDIVTEIPPLNNRYQSARLAFWWVYTVFKNGTLFILYHRGRAKEFDYRTRFLTLKKKIIL